MLISILESFLLALSLSADCFAVTTCSSVSLGSISWKKALPVAVVFGCVQTGLLLAGWLLGDLVVGYVGKVARAIGFILLLYVGGSMILETLRNKCEARNLNGLKNVIIGAIATSIDALGVGVSLSMSRPSVSKMMLDLSFLFTVTMLSVIAGMFGGQKLGRRFGKYAQIIGGSVLILIGLNILFEFF